MTIAKRVVMVDDDEKLLQLVSYHLRPPEFELHAFSDARDALMRLHDIGPDLIICDMMMPMMDGRTFFGVVKKSEILSSIPFIFLSGVQASDEILEALGAGADDFLNKPFPVRRLVEKVRATLRMADRLATREVRPDAVWGNVGPSGILPLLKLCEDGQLTGRFRLEAPGEVRWLEFLAGDLVRGGGTPEVPGEDPLDLLLAMEGGTYWIEQRPVSVEAGGRDEAERPRPRPRPAVPLGRYSVVQAGSKTVQVQTEGEHRPNFTVTTVVAQEGQGVRKIETAWPHPLQRLEDRDIAKLQIDRQHDRIVDSVRELASERASRREVWGLDGRGVEPSVLAWAVSFVGEQAWPHIGRVTSVVLLRRIHKRLAEDHEVLRAFRVTQDGRVLFDLPGRSRLPEGAVQAAADWVAVFLAEAGEIESGAARIRVREVTRMRGTDLANIGFYAAVDAALGRTALAHRSSSAIVH